MNFVEQLMRELDGKTPEETLTVKAGVPHIMHINIKGETLCKSVVETNQDVSLADFKKRAVRELSMTVCASAMSCHFFPEKIEELRKKYESRNGIEVPSQTAEEALKAAKEGKLDVRAALNKPEQKDSQILLGLPFAEDFGRMFVAKGVTETGVKAALTGAKLLIDDSAFRKSLEQLVESNITVRLECA